MKWWMVVLMVAGAMMVRAETIAQNTEKVVVAASPQKETASVAFPGYNVEKIILVTDRGVIIPWRIIMPK